MKNFNEYLLRPFRRKDFCKVPKNWIKIGPDFIGVASGKSGTSWWYKLLLQHPQIQHNRLKTKELQYFYHFVWNSLTNEDINIYNDAFAKPYDCICGEWSPGYLHYPLVIETIANFFPDIKVLAIVRNPVDRLLSALNQKFTRHANILGLANTKNEYNIYKIYSAMQVSVANSILYNPFKKLLEYFERQQILVLQYEKCVKNPKSELKRTFQFLGIDDEMEISNLNLIVNKSHHIINEGTDELKYQFIKYFSDDILKFSELFPEIEMKYWQIDR